MNQNANEHTIVIDKTEDGRDSITCRPNGAFCRSIGCVGTELIKHPLLDSEIWEQWKIREFRLLHPCPESLTAQNL